VEAVASLYIYVALLFVGRLNMANRGGLHATSLNQRNQRKRKGGNFLIGKATLVGDLVQVFGIIGPKVLNISFTLCMLSVKMKRKLRGVFETHSQLYFHFYQKAINFKIFLFFFTFYITSIIFIIIQIKKTHYKTNFFSLFY
jgi:hypothetical protein